MWKTLLLAAVLAAAVGQLPGVGVLASARVGSEGALPGASLLQTATSTATTTPPLTAEAMESVSVDEAVEIMRALEPEEAARVLNETSLTRVSEIMAKMPIDESAEVWSHMAPKKAGSVMEALPTEWATEVVELVPEARLISRLPEVSPPKLWRIPFEVLAERLPSVPVLHLDFWETPVVGPGLPGPVSEQVDDTRVDYTVPATGEGDWSLVTGSPAPFDTVWAKFNRRLTDVRFVVQNLVERPVATRALPAGRMAGAFLRVDVENAEPEDISVIATKSAVEKSFLDVNQLHKWSVEFNRFDVAADAWVPFPSKRIMEDDEKILFAVVLPGFSDLAITGSSELPEQIFEVRDISFSPPTPGADEPVTVSATATNKSGGRTFFPAQLWIDNSIEATEAVDLAPGASAPFSFTFTRPAGTYKVRGERLVAELPVSPKAVLPVTGDVAPGGRLLAGMTAAGVALVVGGAVAAMGRRAGRRSD